MYRSTGWRSKKVLSISSESWNTPPEIAQAPTAITILGSGVDRKVSSSAFAIFLVTGPVITTPSAWRGEATKSIPYLPMSKFALEQALSSISHELQPPAET